MYAIVEIAGQQFKVEKNQEIYVHRLEGNEGAKVEFNSVYLIDNGGKVTVGAPKIDGAKVDAKIISHVKGEKVLSFQKEEKKRISENEWSSPVVYKDPDRKYFRKIINNVKKL